MQQANKFDKETVNKVLKGALIAGSGTTALYLLSFLESVEFTNINLAAIVTFITPVLVNAIKEYMSGSISYGQRG